MLLTLYRGEIQIGQFFKFDTKGLEKIIKNIEKELTRQVNIGGMPVQRDSEELLKLILERYKITGDAVVDINIRDCLTVPNIGTNIGDILDDLIIHGCIGSNSSVFSGGGLGIYLTTDGIEYFKNKQNEERKMERNVTYNVNGGQVNIANDNATIHAKQNNGMGTGELEVIIKNIADNLSGLNKDNADELKDIITMVSDEFSKPEPKSSKLRLYVSLLAPMFTIANGIPLLSKNIQNLIDYITPYIH